MRLLFLAGIRCHLVVWISLVDGQWSSIDNVALSCQGNAKRLHAIAMDVTDEKSIQDAAAAISAETGGRIDLIINTVIMGLSTLPRPSAMPKTSANQVQTAPLSVPKPSRASA